MSNQSPATLVFLLAERLPIPLQIQLLKETLIYFGTYTERTPENEELLRSGRDRLRELESDSSKSPDPKARSSPPDKVPAEEDKSKYQWQSYSVTGRLSPNPARDEQREILKDVGLLPPEKEPWYAPSLILVGQRMRLVYAEPRLGPGGLYDEPRVAAIHFEE